MLNKVIVQIRQSVTLLYVILSGLWVKTPFSFVGFKLSWFEVVLLSHYKIKRLKYNINKTIIVESAIAQIVILACKVSALILCSHVVMIKS